MSERFCFLPQEDRQVGRNIGGLYNVSYLHLCLIYIIQLFPEGEVNSGGYIQRREASRYISTALHRL